MKPPMLSPCLCGGPGPDYPMSLLLLSTRHQVIFWVGWIKGIILGKPPHSNLPVLTACHVSTNVS